MPDAPAIMSEGEDWRAAGVLDILPGSEYNAEETAGRASNAPYDSR